MWLYLPTTLGQQHNRPPHEHAHLTASAAELVEAAAEKPTASSAVAETEGGAALSTVAASESATGTTKSSEAPAASADAAARPSKHSGHPHHHHEKQTIDYLGSVLAVGFVIAFCLAMTWGGSEYAWGSGQIITCLVMAFACLIAFVAVEGLQASHPIMPMRLFRVRNFSAAVLVSFFGG